MAENLDIFVIISLDNIFIYTKDVGQAHVNTVWWVFEELEKHDLFVNFKKCWFYKDKFRFLGHVMSVHKVRIKNEKIEVVKNLPKPKFIRDMQVFLRFANFYWRFIQGFSKIAKPLTLMLRILSFSRSSTILQSLNVADKDEVDENSSNRSNLSNLSLSTRSTRAGYLSFGGAKRDGSSTKKGVKAARNSDYLISAAKKAFKHLRHAFTQVPILQHFDPKQYIRMETDVSGYAIGGVLSQLTLNDMGQWHLVAYYSQKMIPAKTWYKTHNGEFLTIVETFKTWRHYLKDCKYKVLVFIY